MRDFLLRLPRWLIVTGVAVSAAAVLAVPIVSKSLSGWPLVFTLAGGAAFAALTILLNQLQQWQQQQASKLDIAVKSIPDTLHLHSYADLHEVLAKHIERERAKCLKSLDNTKSNIETKTSQPKSKKTGSPKIPTVGELEDIENRLEAGNAISEEEREQLAAARESIRQAVDRLHTQLSIPKIKYFSGGEDTRSENDYINEVESYLKSYSRFLIKKLVKSYIEHELGRLQITILNKTDRTFTEIEIRLETNHRVNALDPSDIDISDIDRPERPRPFGARSNWLSDSPLTGILTGSRPLLKTPKGRPPGPSIENNQSFRVTFDPITVRPHGTENLDALAFMTYEPAGTKIEMTWEATATNAEGRLRGTIKLEVTESPLPIKELLQDESSEQ